MKLAPASVPVQAVDVQFPHKLQFLFDEYRFKVAHGGRGSAKSWSFARALLILGCQSTIRVLCTREVQSSIKDSVHKLLKDQVEAMGMGGFYRVLETEIRGANGTEFLFAGLSDKTATSIKSFEGCDICWVEEAQSVTKRSWDILIPTIRKGGSEIWVSFNPELDSDDTWVRFIENTPPNSMVVEVNYFDNPWFSKELDDARKHCLLTDRDNYDNIWLGKTKAAVAGAIYAKEIEKAMLEKRVTRVPYDPMLKVHVVFDLGWNDAMTVGFYQRAASEIRVIDYIEDSHKTLDWYGAEIKNRRYNLGKVWLPHDGEHKNIQTGKSAKEVMEALDFDVGIVPNVGVEDGIRTARMMFARTVFDETKADRLVHCLKRYKRRINKQSNEPEGPLHDEFSHGGDNYRYAALVEGEMTNGSDVYSSGRRRGGSPWAA
ncbi:PBSX family phage terminase large subunit [Roseateles sp.]|uniref:PBSX family phage terminase large subunit n=1 Tax=Roseateles sp. TaxID=1971397 RepID=UPI002E099B2E|nr:PBSX family phage terminase large subunit [Roseateles sp.]